MILNENESFTLLEYGIGFNCTSFYPKYHSHTFWEFMFIASPVLHKINGREEILDANHIVIIHPNDSHLIAQVTPPPSTSNIPTHLNLKITDSKLRELLAPISPDLYDKLLASDTLNKKLEANLFQPYNNLMHDLLWLNDEKLLCPLIKSTIVKMVNEFLDVLYASEYGGSSNIPDIIKTVVYRMNTQQYLGCSIKELLSDQPYSHMQISRLFKQFTGKTMQEYFISSKLKFACKLLSHTDKKIIDIASSLGFNSLSHFNHIFKKAFDSSPGEYRKKAQPNL